MSSDSTKTNNNDTLPFRELLNYMRNGVAVYRTEDNGDDFVFVEYNKAAERIDGLERENVLGKKVSQVFPGISGFGLFDVLRKVWLTGEPEYHPRSFYYDNRISGWRENYIYKLGSGEVVAVYNDITDNVALEERVTYLNKVLLAIRNVNQTIVFVEDQNRMLQQICDVLVETKGYLGLLDSAL